MYQFKSTRVGEVLQRLRESEIRGLVQVTFLFDGHFDYRIFKDEFKNVHDSIAAEEDYKSIESVVSALAYDASVLYPNSSLGNGILS